MTKKQAIKIFGSVKLTAQALDISVQAVYQWPEKLDQAQTDRVTGAAIRLKLIAAA